MTDEILPAMFAEQARIASRCVLRGRFELSNAAGKQTVYEFHEDFTSRCGVSHSPDSGSFQFSHGPAGLALLNLLIQCGFTIQHVEEFCPTADQIAAKPELAETHPFTS
jgi:hypothetical protein